MMTTTRERQDVYEIVTGQVIEALEKGTVPWHQPWDNTQGLPRSLTSNKPYRGLNVFLLAYTGFAHEYTSPLWGTYKRIAEKGGQVRKGEHGTVITFWKPMKIKDKETHEEKTIFFLRFYRVFNVDQADWPEGEKPECKLGRNEEHDPIEACEEIIRGYPKPPKITFNGNEAYYQPGTDHLVCPPESSFESAEYFYGTLFHEMIHSTGHKKRLDRHEGGECFGNAAYSKEELVAEMGSCLLRGVAGIDDSKKTGESADYIRGWLTVLQNDKRFVVHAAAQAQHAADHILGVKFADNGDDS